MGNNMPESARVFFPERLDRTEFYWKYHDGIKTFEVEEISSIDYRFDAYYLNRYVHSERDIALRVLKHFDGAVKVYLENEYPQRHTIRMPKQAKCFKKPKLFRIDAKTKEDENGNKVLDENGKEILIGNIDIDEWIELLSLFFKGNAMIIEYFDPAQFQEMFADWREDE